MLIPPTSTNRDGGTADRALKRLAGAVLIQALQDASSGPRRFREEALDWISGKAGAGFSFDFCCALLGRAPDDVRWRLMKFNYIPKYEADSESLAYPYAVALERQTYTSQSPRAMAAKAG